MGETLRVCMYTLHGLTERGSISGEQEQYQWL